MNKIHNEEEKIMGYIGALECYFNRFCILIEEDSEKNTSNELIDETIHSLSKKYMMYIEQVFSLYQLHGNQYKDELFEATYGVGEGYQAILRYRNLLTHANQRAFKSSTEDEKYCKMIELESEQLQECEEWLQNQLEQHHEVEKGYTKR